MPLTQTPVTKALRSRAPLIISRNGEVENLDAAAMRQATAVLLFVVFAVVVLLNLGGAA